MPHTRKTLLLRFFDQLQQDAAGAGRMHKHIAITFRSEANFIRCQPPSRSLQPLHGRFQILDLNRDVVQSWPAAREKLGNRRIRARRFKEFNAGVAQRQHRDDDAFGWNLRSQRRRDAQRVLVERQRIVDRLNGNPNMVNFQGRQASIFRRPQTAKQVGLEFGLQDPNRRFGAGVRAGQLGDQQIRTDEG